MATKEKSISKVDRGLNYKQVEDLIHNVGSKQTIFVQGEMGIGKSTMLKNLGKRNPGYKLTYLDLTTIDTGDFALPTFEEEDGRKVSLFAPNKDLGFTQDKPVIIMLDEFPKASKSVQNACLRLCHERKMGEYALPENSIVFVTGNLSQEGLGDLVKPHFLNRITRVKLRKPIVEEWLKGFAYKAKIHPVIIASVEEEPRFFATFEEIADPNLNQFIYHPADPSRISFVTPRSLESASDILYAHSNNEIDDATLDAALVGTIGRAAQMHIKTKQAIYKDMPKLADILKDPNKAKLPSCTASTCMVTLSLGQAIDKNNADAVITYMMRLKPEQNAIFAYLLSEMQDKLFEIVGAKKLQDWSQKYSHLLVNNQD